VAQQAEAVDCGAQARFDAEAHMAMSAATQTTPLLVLTLDNSQPVELLDYANVLAAVADEYSGFLEGRADDGAVVGPSDLRLQIAALERGSLIAELAVITPLVLPFMENVNTVITFAEYLKQFFADLVDRSRVAPGARRNVENALQIVEPVAKDSGSQLNIQTRTLNQTINNIITINYSDANVIQNSARRQLEIVREVKTGVHHKVVMTLEQAKKDPTSKVGDRARIESIHPRPVKVVFEPDSLKVEVVASDDNPFHKAFLVDVEIETVYGRPILYKVVALHEALDIPDDTEAA
jgi:hypothetical protein